MSTHYVEQYQGYTIVYDEENGAWGAYVDDVPGVCFTVADTQAECERLIHEALAVHLDALQRDRRERPWLYEDQTPAAGVG